MLRIISSIIRALISRKIFEFVINFFERTLKGGKNTPQELEYDEENDE
jgi:hypothetical protein